MVMKRKTLLLTTEFENFKGNVMLTATIIVLITTRQNKLNVCLRTTLCSDNAVVAATCRLVRSVSEFTVASV